MRVFQNPDADYVKEIKKRLKENNGYCPCKLERNPDTKCPCKEFRDMTDRGERGYCGCGLYFLQEDDM